MPRIRPSVQTIRDRLEYDPGTGRITYKEKFARGILVGASADRPQKSGYLHCYCGDRYDTYSHIVAWVLMTGNWPDQTIDHRDTVKSNNRWGNLRQVTSQVNTENTRHARTTNLSGYLGVTTKDDGRRFAATIMVDGKHKHIGRFGTPKEAHAAYVEEKRKLHKGCTL